MGDRYSVAHYNCTTRDHVFVKQVKTKGMLQLCEPLNPLRVKPRFEAVFKYHHRAVLCFIKHVLLQSSTVRFSNLIFLTATTLATVPIAVTLSTLTAIASIAIIAASRTRVTVSCFGYSGRR